MRLVALNHLLAHTQWDPDRWRHRFARLIAGRQPAIWNGGIGITRGAFFGLISIVESQTGPTMSSVISDFAERYRLPPELTRFIDEGFLAPLSDNWEEKSIEFHIPSKTVTDSHGRTTSFSVVWIHPDFNREFCHYFDKQPGDLPNFYVIKDTTDLCHEPIDQINTFDDLVGWLESMKSADVR